MKASSEKLLAETYGMAAHELGKPAIPALDPNLTEMLNIPVEDPMGKVLLKAWLTGWHKANLMQRI